MEKIRVGQVVNTHGIKGECKVKVLTDFPEDRFKINQQLYLSKDGSQDVSVKVKAARWHQDHLLVTFDEITDMTSAQQYKGYDVLIDRNEIEDLDDGYYAFELIGFKVFDERNQLLGTVKKIEETLANDVIRIERLGKRDLLVPFVDAFVLSIDEKSQSMTIQWMEGLE